jgi:hypothetical protein
MKKQYLIHILAVLLLSVQTIQAQEKRLPSELEINLKYGADRLGKRRDVFMQKFRENRLGAFIHTRRRMGGKNIPRSSRIA